MAIIHRATISPTKQELLAHHLGGPVEVLGAYRFDDPAGAVGVEGLLVRHDGLTRHVVLTYRDAPVPGDAARLITTMEHTSLGRRWVYDGTTDAVAVACYRRALLGEQTQAAEEIWENGERVDTRQPTAVLELFVGREATSADSVIFVSEIQAGASSPAGPHLVATWNGGQGVVAGSGD